MKILITAGGTSEPIDQVRILTNRSTGHTGAELARLLATHGHQITLLRAVTAEAVPEIKQLLFDSFDSLDFTLQTLLAQEKFDLIMHAAAVSDYRLDRVEINGETVAEQPPKLPSGAQITLRLIPTHKIIDRLLSYAQTYRPLVIGFKLTSHATEEQARQAAARVQADWVLHNDTLDIQAGKRIFTVYKQGEKKQCLHGLLAVADWVNSLSVPNAKIPVGQIA